MSKADGTERLCQAVYGKKEEPGNYLGGSEAKMLHDAADLIEKLRAEAFRFCQQGINMSMVWGHTVEALHRTRDLLSSLIIDCSNDDLEMMAACDYEDRPHKKCRCIPNGCYWCEMTATIEASEEELLKQEKEKDYSWFRGEVDLQIVENMVKLIKEGKLKGPAQKEKE